MTSGNINRSLGLSALVVSTITGLLVSTAGAAHAQTTFTTLADGKVQLTEGGSTQEITAETYYYANNPAGTITSNHNGITAVAAGKPAYNYGTNNQWNGFEPPYLIGPAEDASDSNLQGYYDYSFTFTVTSASTLSVEAFADNNVNALYINDNAATLISGVNAGVTATTGNGPSSANFTYALSAPGTYTFDLLTYNQAGTSGNPAAAAFAGSATPEPGVFVTAASMLSMTGLGLVRGRRRAKGVKIAA